MVRKWSYLNPIITKKLSDEKFYLQSLYNFKVFKVTIRFRKHTSGITKFVRKSFAKRKHKTNWLTLSYTLKQWAIFYIKSRQFNRYYQAMSLFTYMSIGVAPNFTIKQSEKFNINSGISFLSCSKNIINAFFFKTTNPIVTPIKNNPSSMMLMRDLDEVNKNNDINPGLIVFDNLAYPYNYKDTEVTTPKNLIMLLNKNIFHYNIKFIINVYKILIKLTLFLLK